MEGKIIDAGTFVEVRTHRDELDVAPPPPPETFDGPLEKSGKSAGVLGLMDMMVKELESDVKDGEYEEKSAQKEYSEIMSSSQTDRQQCSKSIVDKTATKAQ